MPYRWLVAKDVSMPLTGAQQRPSAKRGLSATEKNTTAPGWEETELMVRRPLAGADRSCWEEGWLEVQRRRLHLAARQSWKKVTREGSKDHHSTTAAATVLTQAAARTKVDDDADRHRWCCCCLQGRESCCDEDRERQGRNSRQLRAQAEEEGNINAWKKKRELPGLQWLLTVLLVEEKAAAQHRHRQQQGQQQTQQ